MAYEDTSVPVHKSQGDLLSLVMGKGGSTVGFLCEPPREGFQAKVKIDGCDYHLRITATCRPAPEKRKVGRSSWPSPTTLQWRIEFAQQERRRVWRVLYYYLKNAFECSDAGVVELREILLPHIVMPDGRTIGDHILPRLAEAVQQDPSRLLGAGAAQ